jgi:hypothetical protein
VLEIGSRRRDQAPPPTIVWDALIDPYRPGSRQWLELRSDEVGPRILEAVRPRLVVWSSLWAERADDRIRFDIDEAQGGTSLRWTLLTPVEAPDEKTLGHMRYRLNYLINGQLRYSFGQ